MLTMSLLLLAQPISQAQLLGSSRFDCKYLDYYLTLESIGSHRVEHVLKLNGQQKVSEISRQQWFVEQVKCTKQGFELSLNRAPQGQHDLQLMLLQKQTTAPGYRLRPVE